MGRIKTTLIKRTGSKLYRESPDKFTADFQNNKQALDAAADIPSKKLRNTIAGYITKLHKEKR